MREEPGSSRLRIQPFIDRLWLQLWPKICLSEARHEKVTLTPQQDLRGVRVVGVVQYCIIFLPKGADYLALSHVWGNAEYCKDDFHLLRCNVESLKMPGSLTRIRLPRTISEVCKVCIRLDYQNLWIDRLCIVQDDPLEQKSTQLDQMASFYNSAAMTLVATSGENTAHSLSGVTRSKPVHQESYRVDESVEPISRHGNLPESQHMEYSGLDLSRAYSFQGAFTLH